MEAEKTRMEIAIDQMRELQNPKGDAGIQHSMADEILCEMLTKLGCHHLVAEWRKVQKWYA